MCNFHVPIWSQLRGNVEDYANGHGERVTLPGGEGPSFCFIKLTNWKHLNTHFFMKADGHLNMTC